MKQEKEKKKGSHIKKAERLELSILLNRKYSLRDISRVLDRSVSSISCEITRNSTKGVYDPLKANHKAYVRRKYSKYQGMKIEGNKELREYVVSSLKKDWSPEEICGRIREIDKDIQYVGFKGIYRYVSSPYGRRLERYLRHSGKRRKREGYSKVTQLKNRQFIDDRPLVINTRERYGDWEGDFIVSGKQGKESLLVLHERKTRYVLIRKIPSRSPKLVNTCLSQLIRNLSSFNSLTLDNDIAFRKHERLSQSLDCPVFFCHPYHSWEKGGVENTNKLIRQYVRKGSDISKYSDKYIQRIQDKLNTRPRKSLNYKTPEEVMTENNQFKEKDQCVKLELDVKKETECSV